MPRGEAKKQKSAFFFFLPLEGSVLNICQHTTAYLVLLTSDVSWPQCKEGLAGFISGLHAFASTVLLLMNPSYSSLVWLPISYEKALEAQSCLTLCHAVDCSLLGSSAQGIFQARILEWVAVPLSRGSSWPRDRTCVSYDWHCRAGSLPLAPPGKPLSYVGGSNSKENSLIPITPDFCLCLTVTRVTEYPQSFVWFMFAGATSLWHRLWEWTWEGLPQDLRAPAKPKLRKTWEDVWGNTWSCLIAQIKWISED